ncbi:Phosphoenolpyruvate/pyruvate domain-containing protein [Phellopilus nigrolimitatus]|nr:Phosphoenolpyruvate/pyruvate domain-containing protein [Phellopilus nigrolimitatus]
MPMKIPLKEVLDAGKTAFGVWNTIPGASIVRTIASTPGISWVLVDAEHGHINDTHLYTHITAISAAGRSPLVRVPEASAWWAKRALDAGAHGLMVPLLRTAADARDAVASVQYPPKGIRGFGPMYTHHAFGEDCTPQEYKEGAGDLLVLAQIETKEAVANLEEIAQVEGLGVLFIGPFDLSLNLGVDFGSSAHEDAIQKVLEVSHKYGKKAAIYCTNGDQARVRAGQGFDIISIATDVDVLSQGYAAHISSATGANVNVGSGYSAK